MTTSTSEPSAEASAPKLPAEPAKPRRSLIEWFLRRRALAEAQRAVPELDGAQRERMLRARAALELADRTLDPVDELKAGRGTPLAGMLYREAIYWGLLAQDSAFTAANLESALSIVPRQLLLDVAGSETLLAELEAAAHKPSAQTWLEPHAEQQADARRLQRFAKALLRRFTDPELKVARLLLQRVFRSLLLLGVLVLAVAGIVLSSRSPLGPDLAANRPWKTSSVLPNSGAPSAVLFHTQEEQDPWLEFDLGKPVEFSRVEVQNRSDCCDERAVPLVIEVSDDGAKWREVARKAELFNLWNADFSKVKARYVRARVLARTFLHLERVSVRSR